MSDTLFGIGIGFVILVVGFLLFVAVPRMAWVKSQCLAKGYAEHEVDWKLRAYCVQRDYRGVMKAIPLEELK
jgi:competence protein ComGC